MKYKLFGRTGLRVSELCLGTMTFGTEWGWGSDYESSKKVFEAFTNAGGNFIDTANRYTEGSSEKFIGDFTSSDRAHFVIATKYSLFDKKGDPNYSGNHRKNMFRSLDESLKRLKTDYIDIFYLHVWDFTTPIEEIMRAMDDLIRAGKVQYLAISDTPAWMVAKAQILAEWKNWTAFAGLQVEYSLIQRTPERDLIPMAGHFGMALTPWAPLAGGALSGKYLQPTTSNGRVMPESIRRNERSNRIAAKVVEIAAESGMSPAHVALNWCRQAYPVCVPIVGARTVEQMEDNLQCVHHALTKEQMDALNEVSAIELGFPHDFLSSENVKKVVMGETQDIVLNHRGIFLP